MVVLRRAVARALSLQIGNRKSAIGNPLPPPRKGHSKTEHTELFRKLRLEFDHIETYGVVSEHFDELREQLEQQP